MDALRASRVVVIDNQWNEAAPLLKALWSRGVGAVYSNGTAPDSEAGKLSGVRLIFLDLELDNSVSGAHQFLNTTIGLLDQIVNLREPGIGIVYWTKHAEQAANFEKLVAERLAHFRPMFMLGQDKIKYLSESGPTIDALGNEISAKLSSNKAHAFLCAWEGAVLSGAISTTSAICPGGDSDEKCMKSLAALAKAAGGLSASDERAVHDLCEAMHELLSDAIPPKGFFDQIRAFGADLRPRVENPGIDITTRLRLNRLLLLDPEPADVKGSHPGAVLMREQLAGLATMRSADVAAIQHELEDLGLSAVKAETHARNARQCFINISPPCDVANSKCPWSRLVGGLLVKIGGDAKPPDLPASARQYGKELPVFELKGVTGIADGSYWLCLNARLLFTVPSTSLSDVGASVALRTSVVSDLLAWFAGHASRPGIIAVV